MKIFCIETDRNGKNTFTTVLGPETEPKLERLGASIWGHCKCREWTGPTHSLHLQRPLWLGVARPSGPWEQRPPRGLPTLGAATPGTSGPWEQRNLGLTSKKWVQQLLHQLSLLLASHQKAQNCGTWFLYAFVRRESQQSTMKLFETQLGQLHPGTREKQRHPAKTYSTNLEQ